MKSALVIAGVAACIAFPAQAAPITVLTPPGGEKAYQIAGEAFVNLWEKVTGRRPDQKVCMKSPGQDLPAGDLALIGSDAVHPLVHQLIRQGAIEALGIEYGGDGYRIVSISHQGRRYLILAGGSGRSTLYAVYDFFRRQAGVEYFWDGDVVPRRGDIEIDRLDVAEKPQFGCRGLRYFAHRGLHRFQAEHWDLEDWKREIDWLVKKRFNLFMLRTGIDDLFQRAFPGEVPYPPTDAKDPDGVDRSYDDRTSFWPLRYRGQLRKEVLRYAFDRGLLHPEDTGTLTHWYSHTPSSFYRSRPDFPVITDQKSGYSLRTQAIWDIEDQRAWDAYWRLTETHVREFGLPRMFHTIGLAERTFGKDARENFQRKLYVYRKTQQMLRERYPDAPLVIAGWDFIGWWKDEDVRRLLREFDPQKTIVFDYTADDADKVTFRDWGLLGKFPWMFGIFHSYARNSDIHEDYRILAERLRMAATDERCLGLAAWSEISHSDTFLLEYLAANSWRPAELDAVPAVARYCRTRYAPELAAAMEPIWKDLLVTSQSVHWSHGGNRWLSFGEAQYRMLAGSQFSTLTPARIVGLREEYARLRPSLRPAPDVLVRLAGLSARWQADPLWRRDALDMARTIANRALLASLMSASLEMEGWREGKGDAARIRKLAAVSKGLLDGLADVLALSDDFSMGASLKRLQNAQPLGDLRPTVNPHSEQTLKSNAENDYCRSHHYELARYVYRPEMDVHWDWVLRRIDSGDKSPWRRPAEFGPQAKAIQDKFYATALTAMAPTPAQRAAPLAEAATRLSGLVRQLLDSPSDY
jgi:hypothetical protein